MQNPEKLKLARVAVVNDANGQQRNKLYPLQVGFQKYGQSGIEVSDWLPHIGGLRRRHRRRPLDVHDRRQPRRPDAVPLRPAHARRRVPDLGRLGPLRPGLAQRQPAAVHLDGQARVLEREGRPLPRPAPTTRCRSASTRPTRSTIGKPEGPIYARRTARSASTWSGELNRLRAVEYPDDPALAAADQGLRAGLPDAELGARGARLRPAKAEATQALYGLDDRETATSACRCWRRRRLVERGVRFIQVQHGAGGAGVWDAHGGLKANHAQQLPRQSTSRSPACSRT